MISFQRRFLCYLDTVEIDPSTSKAIQPVTLFLFSDKIMVVKRPNYEADGLELCGLDQRMYEGSERKDFIIRRESFIGKMKFIGWASLNDIDIFQGPGINGNSEKVPIRLLRLTYIINRCLFQIIIYIIV